MNLHIPVIAESSLHAEYQGQMNIICSQDSKIQCNKFVVSIEKEVF
jgi:hypothetical protein